MFKNQLKSNKHSSTLKNEFEDANTNIQSWPEIASIAHFCSLFRKVFDLLEFEIHELEESLLLMGTEDDTLQLVPRLLVRLLTGCSKSVNKNINEENYNTYLRRLFLKKLDEQKSYSFPTPNIMINCHALVYDNVDFVDIPLRQRVKILRQICDFRLDSDDVSESIGGLEPDGLRISPLGTDSEGSVYWYFYGTRLYKETPHSTSKSHKSKKKKKKKDKKKKRRGSVSSYDEFNAEIQDSCWQVVCLTPEDWHNLASKYSKSNSDVNRALYRTLKNGFLPEITKMFADQEKEAKKRLLMMGPKRTSNRLERKRREQEEKDKTEAMLQEEQLQIEEEYDEKIRHEKMMENLRAYDNLKAGTSRADKSTDEDETFVPPIKMLKGCNSVNADDDSSSSDSSYSSESEIWTKIKKPNNGLKVTFSNALLRVGTKSTKDSSLRKNAFRPDKTNSSLQQKSLTNKKPSRLMLRPPILSSKPKEDETRVTYGFYGGFLPVNHGYLQNNGTGSVSSTASIDSFDSSTTITSPKSSSEDTVSNSLVKLAEKSKRSGTFSNWGGPSFMKNLDARIPSSQFSNLNTDSKTMMSDSD